MIDDLALISFGYSIGALTWVLINMWIDRKFKKLYQWQQGVLEDLKRIKDDTTRSRDNGDSKEGDTSRD